MANGRIISGMLLVSLIGLVGLGACGDSELPTKTISSLPPTVAPTQRATPAAVLPTAETNPPDPSLAFPQEGGPTPELNPESTSTPDIATQPTEDRNQAASATPSVLQHSVQAGETLLGIAVDYGISMAAIQLANGMGSSIDLLAGQTLSVPRGKQWLNEGYFWTVHVVQSGETLVGLAETYDLTVEQILRVNAIADPSLIHIDQQLVIPLEQLVTLNAPRPSATRAAVAAAPAAAPSDATAAPAPSGASAETASTFTETAEPVDQPTQLPAAGPPAGPGDWPAYLLTRINQVRAQHGLNALTPVPALNSAAQAHANDCAQRGWGSHVGSDGAVLTTRLERAGYLSRNWGENWVQAHNPERAFDWWYGEIPPNDPHRRNILSPRYTEIGVGIANMGSGYIFVTDFGRR